MSMSFGQKLCALRTRQQLTQADVARQLGVNRGYINNLEAGRRTPSLRFVLHVAEHFGVATDYLLRETSDIEAPQWHLPRTVDAFGARLQQLRKQQQLTQAALAAELGLNTQAHISLLEAGHKEPSIDLLVRIATYAGVATDALLTDGESDAASTPTAE